MSNLLQTSTLLQEHRAKTLHFLVQTALLNPDDNNYVESFRITVPEDILVDALLRTVVAEANKTWTPLSPELTNTKIRLRLGRVVLTHGTGESLNSERIKIELNGPIRWPHPYAGMLYITNDIVDMGQGRAPSSNESPI